MTDRTTARPKVEQLELNKETVQDLSESETEGAEGGMCGTHHVCPPPKSKDKLCPESGRPICQANPTGGKGFCAVQG